MAHRNGNDEPTITIDGPLAGEPLTIDCAASPASLTEDERAYAKRTFDRAHAAAEVARKATRALEDANAAVLSYRDHLWEKYGLGEADSFDTETGAITRAADREKHNEEETDAVREATDRR